jgi:hypothetical protein
MIRVFALAPAYLLLASIFDLDDYRLRIMHYVVPFCALFLAYDTYQKKQDFFFVMFLITIVLYNPLIPTDYYEQTGWIFFHLVFGAVLIAKVFKWGMIAPDKVTDQEIRRSTRRAIARQNAATYKIISNKKHEDQFI